MNKKQKRKYNESELYGVDYEKVLQSSIFISRGERWEKAMVEYNALCEKYGDPSQFVGYDGTVPNETAFIKNYTLISLTESRKKDRQSAISLSKNFEITDIYHGPLLEEPDIARETFGTCNISVYHHQKSHTGAVAQAEKSLEKSSLCLIMANNLNEEIHN